MANGCNCGVQGNIGPSKTEGFAASATARGEEDPCGQVSILGGELPERYSCSAVHALTFGDLAEMVDGGVAASGTLRTTRLQRNTSFRAA